MTFSRRQFLSMGITAGGVLINPLKAFGWGSFKDLANTHQIITQNAMEMLRRDPALGFNIFPGYQDIIEHDWISGNFKGAYGTGPDTDSLSNYSDHYYNPQTGQGNGPNAVGTQFNNLILQLHNNSTGKATARAAAWAAHFLNDMHVPYHMVGLPATEAYRRAQNNNGQLSIDESGPQIFYGRRFKPPQWWGHNQNFSNALATYVKYHPPVNGKPGTGDWYDPWYYNSVGSETSKAIFGSHGKWEFFAHQGWNVSDAQSIYQKLANQSYYNPLWENAKIPLNQTPWSFAAGRARIFAYKCAKETFRNLMFYYGYPNEAICRAIRSTLTLYRSALTLIRIDSIEYVRENDGQYKITCRLQNLHQHEAFQTVDVRLQWRENNGQWRTQQAIRLNEDLRPTNSVSVWWFLPLGFNKKVEIICDVTGVYPKTPDLGYKQKQLTFITDQNYQNPEPETLPGPQPQPSVPSQNPLAQWLGTWRVTSKWECHPGNSVTWDFTVKAKGGSFNVTVRGTAYACQISGNSIQWKMTNSSDNITMTFQKQGTTVTGRFEGTRKGYTGNICGSYTGRKIN